MTSLKMGYKISIKVINDQNTSEEKHMNHSQREFYDRFSISLTSMQILMTTKAEHKVLIH